MFEKPRHEQVAGAGLRKDPCGNVEEGAAAGCAAQALSGCLVGSPGGGRLSQTRQCWPYGRDFLGLVCSKCTAKANMLLPAGILALLSSDLEGPSVSHSLLSCLDRAWPAMTSPFYHEMVLRGDGCGPGTGFGHGVQAVSDSPAFTFDGLWKDLQSYYLLNSC